MYSKHLLNSSSNLNFIVISPFSFTYIQSINSIIISLDNSVILFCSLNVSIHSLFLVFWISYFCFSFCNLSILCFNFSISFSYFCLYSKFSSLVISLFFQSSYSVLFKFDILEISFCFVIIIFLIFSFLVF